MTVGPRVEEIPAALDGERLDRVVALIAEISRTAASGLIAAGAVQVDGAPVDTGKLRLRAGQQVSVELDVMTEAPEPQAEADVQVDIVHVDDAVIVINKPAGLVVHPAPGHATGTLVNGLLARFPDLAGVGEPHRPGIVHRLDAGTSGLLVVARTPHAYTELVGALAKRRVTREYLTVVWGHLPNPAGIIDAPIGRDPRDQARMAVVVDGRPARTHYRTERTYQRPEVSLLNCALESGRTHQIRVHLAAIGHPVVGDTLYGSARESLPLTRPFLHAAHLAFHHPVTGADLTFDAPLPADLENLLAKLG